MEDLIEVEDIGVEPTTSCMPCKRSSQLSYTPLNGEKTGLRFFRGANIKIPVNRLEIVGVKTENFLNFAGLAGTLAQLV